MSDRSRLAAHAALALAIPLVVFAASTVGTVDSFKSWLLGYHPLSTRNLPHVASLVVGAGVLARYAAPRVPQPLLRWMLGGALLGFLAALIGAHTLATSPLVGILLIAAGATAGWVAAPR